MARILIIDDEAAVHEMLGAALRNLGHEVILATHGRQALNFLRAQPVDLVLTDLVMPEQDGIETIMALRHLFPALPVLAMSGASKHSPLYLEIAAHLGVRRTLTKPFDLATLYAAVDETLERVPAA